MLVLIILTVNLIVSGKSSFIQQPCKPSETTASGPFSTRGPFCSGSLIFEDNFNKLNFHVWKHVLSLSGSGTYEFQWFNNNRSNSFVKNGALSIRPTLLADIFGEDFLAEGSLNLHGTTPDTICTAPFFYGCERVGTSQRILNPIVSARLSTVNSFSFKYGRVEIRAKMPTGDWLAPAIWLFPTNVEYGPYPVSGVIKLAEGRGNVNLTRNGTHIGVEQINHSLVYVPFPGFLRRYSVEYYPRNQNPGWNTKFHKYQLEWTSDHITFSIDDIVTKRIDAGCGFWKRGGFDKSFPGVDNPWDSGSIMAPFDQEFFMGFDLEVGGISRFPDDAKNPYKKPWSNVEPGKSATDFWNARKQWIPTWNLKNRKHSSYQIDYVRVWAI